MRAAARAARNSTPASASTATRAFSASVGRSKELAGDIGALPNMRHAQRNPVGPLKVRYQETDMGMLPCQGHVSRRIYNADPLP